MLETDEDLPILVSTYHVLAEDWSYVARNANQMCTTERKLAPNGIVHLHPPGLPCFRSIIEERRRTLKVSSKFELSIIGESVGSDADEDKPISLKPFWRKDLDDDNAVSASKKTRIGRFLRLTLPFAKV